MFCVSPHWIGRRAHASLSSRGLLVGACIKAIATMEMIMASTAACGTQCRVNSVKLSLRTRAWLTCRTRSTRLLVNRRLSCLDGEPTSLFARLDGEPCWDGGGDLGCDGSGSLLGGTLVVGGISVASPSAVVRISLTASSLMMVLAVTILAALRW